MIFKTKTLQKQLASPMRMCNIIMLIYNAVRPKCSVGSTLPKLNVNSTLIDIIITTSNSFAFITFLLFYFDKLMTIDLIHKSSYGPYLLANGNLRIVIGHSSRRVTNNNA